MPLSRRDLLAAGFGLAATACTTDGTSPEPTASSTTEPTTTGASSTTTSVATTSTTANAVAEVEAPGYDGASPFDLGVASGDPEATSVVLWTRLHTSSGEQIVSGDQQIAVDVARDSEFGDLVHSSIEPALAAHGHSMHFVANGLEDDTWYWYRFRVGAHTSATGRTRTVPADGGTPLRFGFSSCQHWETGAYAAHRHLAEADLDLFVWLGDYIYESGPSGISITTALGPRVHNSPEVETLEAYRARYALYKSDPDLQAHHAARPWIVTWDDHEVDNNHAGLTTQDGQDAVAFAQRRQAAHQAWWENMPVRLDPPTPGAEFPIYRCTQWGALLDLHMLDGRQYRDPQPTDGEPLVIPGIGDLGVRLLGPTALDPEHTMLGVEQRAWLEQEVAASTATWNVLGNQVYMHGLNAFPGTAPATNTDSWDGYHGERMALLENLASTSDNLIVLSGDFHAATAAEVRSDPFDLDAPVLATEFMAPAISSTFPESLRGLAPLVLGINPQVRHFSPENGYMVCEVTETDWTTEIHLLTDRTSEASAVALDSSWRVQAGSTGITSVS